MVYRYVCNGFLRQIRLRSYQSALPVPRILVLCNHLQNVVATTYIFRLQLSTFIFYNKQLCDIYRKKHNSAKALRKCTAYPVRCKYFSKATSSHSSRIYGNRSSRQYHRPDPLGLSVAVLLTYPHHIQVFAHIPQILNLPLPYPKPNSMFDYI